MAEMTLKFSDDENGLYFELGSDQGPQGVRTRFSDTDQGVELKTILTDSEGNEHTLTDTVDRATAPLEILLDLVQQYRTAFQNNVAAAANRARYERLKREGTPINMATMCLCGHHTGPEFEKIPFQGGIVGVPDHDSTQQTTPAPIMNAEAEAKVRAMLDWLPEDSDEGDAA
jgi:hypothetical protein